MTMEADLLFLRGRVPTGNSDDPATDALAIRRGRILALGSSAELGQIPSKRTIYLNGRTLAPGFIDAHHHLSLAAVLSDQLDLRLEWGSPLELALVLIQGEAGRRGRGEWVRAWGFDESRSQERRFPTLAELDAVSPHHPVVILHASGEAALLNSLALQAMEIDLRSPLIARGLVERDPLSGGLSGVLRGRAMQPFAYPALFRQFLRLPLLQRMSRLADSSQAAARQGITTICDALCPPTLVDTYHALAELGELKCRVSTLLPFEWDGQRLDLNTLGGKCNGELHAGGIKLFADGALRSGGAAFSRSSTPDAVEGGLLADPVELGRQAAAVESRGMRMAIHAFGDRAVQRALAAMQAANASSSGNPRRHRLEHASLASSELIQRMAAAQVVVVAQPRLLFEQGEALAQVCGGEQGPWALPLRAYLEAGLVVAGSSDSPALSLDPLLGMRAALTREMAGGGYLHPDQALTVKQALSLYHHGAAYALGQEEELGAIQCGMAADLLVLSADPFSTPPDAWGESLRVDMTVTAGEVVYSRY